MSSTIKSASIALVAGSVIAVTPATINAVPISPDNGSINSNQPANISVRSQLNMSEFLTLLSEDAHLQHEYLNSPQLTMNAFGLDDLSIAAIVTGDMGLLQGALGDTRQYKKHVF